MDAADQTKFESFSQRLRFAIEKTHTKQADLFNALGITRQTLYRLMNGDANGQGYAFDIAEILKINPIWLAYGRGSMRQADDPLYHFFQSYRKIPLLDTASEINEWLNKKDIDVTNEPKYQYFLSEKEHHIKATFAIKIKDKSLFPTYPAGSVFFITPHNEVFHQQLRLIYIKEMDDLIIRKCSYDNEIIIAEPINSKFFQSIELTKEDRILGSISEIRLYPNPVPIS